MTVSYRTVGRHGDGRGQDYDAVSGVLRFEPGETAKTVTVVVKSDAHDDPGETFTLRLSQSQRRLLGRWRGHRHDQETAARCRVPG